VPALSGGPSLVLAGPGIRDAVDFAPVGLPDDFAARLAGNHALFPRGVDLVLASGAQIAALPRSTRLKG
jgi:alpha-D-ribose 1-methylphosphonate 5-triphosphate synthase subunit PhnH